MLGLFSDTERRVALDVAREVLKNYPAHLAKIELLLRNPIGGFRPVANERTKPAIQQLSMLTNSIASQLCADPLQAENEKRKAWAILIEEWFKETQQCTYQPEPIPASISSTGAKRSNSLTIADLEQMVAFQARQGADGEREKMDALLVQQFRATSNDIAKMMAHDSTPRAVRWMEERTTALSDSEKGQATAGQAIADPQRRLARLRELGGDALFKHGNWQITGIAALVKAEASEGRKRSSEKTIRDDLRAAAELERQEQREGRLFSGLGAR